MIGRTVCGTRPSQVVKGVLALTFTVQARTAEVRRASLKRTRPAQKEFLSGTSNRRFRPLIRKDFPKPVEAPFRAG